MNRRRITAVAAVACAVAALTTVEGVNSTAAPAPAAAKDPAKTSRTALGNGLGRLVAEQAHPQSFARNASTFDPERTVIRDAEGRVLIDLTPQSDTDRAAFRTQAEQLGLVVAATDAKWGTLEGYAPVSAMTSLAALPGTGTIVQAVKPAAASGSVQDQGVAFQNVDKPLARGITGKGITVGALSDSYDSAETYVTGEPLDVHAAQDVASGDLPGPGNRQNQTPVKVLQDVPTEAGGADEGRAMLQIIHDLAPQADLCFATAFAGEVQFADNIRRLADPKAGCGADVVVDDVGYFDEPFFSDGILNDAVDDVTAQGVQYFSSAGNAGEHNAWRAPIRLVPAATAVKNTNLDLSEVDPALYDGGFEDFDPSSGVDPAQDYEVGAAGGLLNLQWDNPIDYAGPTIADPFFTGGGHLDLAGTTDVPFTVPASRVGQQLQVVVDGVPSGGPDLILTVLDPDGNVVAGPVDTGSSPESAVITPSKAGDYTIRVQGFNDTVDADFTASVAQIVAPSKVTDDFNLLLFAADGTYLGSQADVNSLTGRPQELISLPALGPIQVVIARSGTGPLQATTLAQIANGDVFVDEYWDPTAPATYGHPTAAGAVGVAAFDPFKPYLAEYFTSPGSDKLPIYFDSSGNRYKKVQNRTSPLITSVDGANTTFFVSDTPLDPDTLRNFFGTSAAAPHAAAISALVLQANGGAGSVSPKKMKQLLSKSTFKHDLDPFFSSAKADKLTITASGDAGDERSPYAGSKADPNFFKLSYSGKVPLSSITFFGDTASPSANGKGIVFDPRPYVAGSRTSGFPFTVGSTGGGLNASSVFASFRGAGGGQSTTGQYRTLTVSFDRGLKKGQSLGFGVDRDLQSYIPGLAAEGNSADELGGAVLYPSGAVVKDGMQFRAVRADGSSFEGVFRNDLGKGYTVNEGYGMLDAAQAVLGR